MKERPILFSGEMVRAILEGRKTQTRRVVKMPPFDSSDETLGSYLIAHMDGCPYGQVGDRLWVRETWAYCPYRNCFFYRADNFPEDKFKWKPSIHMIRAASRITLEITGIRVERLQDISEEDAIAEGIQKNPVQFDTRLNYPAGSSAAGWHNPKNSFRSLWRSINGKDSWELNPCVWVIEFKQI